MGAPYIDLSICNEALDEVPAPRIASPDENSQEARYCAGQYPGLIREFLEYQEWTFARSRMSLPEIANDRPTEWQHAYQIGTDMIVTGVTVPYTPAGVQLLPPARYGWNMGYQAIDPYAYEVAGSTLYCDIASVVAKARPLMLDSARMPPTFRRALVLELAARVVMPLTRSETRLRALATQAQTMLAMARAADLNRQSPSYGDFLPSNLGARY